MFDALPPMMKPNGAAFLAVAEVSDPTPTVTLGDIRLMDVCPAPSAGYAHAYMDDDLAATGSCRSYQDADRRTLSALPGYVGGRS